MLYAVESSQSVKLITLDVQAYCRSPQCSLSLDTLDSTYVGRNKLMTTVPVGAATRTSSSLRSVYNSD